MLPFRVYLHCEYIFDLELPAYSQFGQMYEWDVFRQLFVSCPLPTFGDTTAGKALMTEQTALWTQLRQCAAHTLATGTCTGRVTDSNSSTVMNGQGRELAANDVDDVTESDKAGTTNTEAQRTPADKHARYQAAAPCLVPANQPKMYCGHETLSGRVRCLQ